MATRIPSLGPRGEGWVVLQFALLVIVAALGGLDLSQRGLVNPWGPIGAGAGVVLIGLGLCLAIRAGAELRAALSPFPRPRAGAPLVAGGVYSVIRHPIYTGLLLGSLGWSLVTASPGALAATAVLALVLDLKSRREEDWLLAAFPEYAAYRRRTRRFVPGLY